MMRSQGSAVIQDAFGFLRFYLFQYIFYNKISKIKAQMRFSLNFHPCVVYVQIFSLLV